jgi:hypothetical protein
VSNPERPDEPTEVSSVVTPSRFREDYDPDPEPWTDPVSGVEYPVRARDVLSPEEYHDYQRERRQRRR